MTNMVCKQIKKETRFVDSLFFSLHSLPDFLNYGQKEEMKRKHEIRPTLMSLEESGANIMPTQFAQTFTRKLVDYMYNWVYPSMHTIRKEFDYVVFTFCEVSATINDSLLDDIITTLNCVRDIKIKQTMSSESIKNEPSFTIELECFIHTDKLMEIPLPHFFEKSLVDNPLSLTGFMKIVGEETNGGEEWNNTWNMPYTFMHKLVDLLCNMNETPADIGIEISYRKDIDIDIYEISIFNYKAISYTLFEYIDDVKPTDYFWKYEFKTSNEESKNYFVVSFMKKPKDSLNAKTFKYKQETFFDNHERRASYTPTVTNYAPKKIRRISEDQIQISNGSNKKRGIISRIKGIFWKH